MTKHNYYEVVQDDLFEEFFASHYVEDVDEIDYFDEIDRQNIKAYYTYKPWLKDENCYDYDDYDLELLQHLT